MSIGPQIWNNYDIARLVCASLEGPALVAAACTARDRLAREAVRHIWGMELELSEVDTKLLAVMNSVRLYVLPGDQTKRFASPNRAGPSPCVVGQGLRTVSQGYCPPSRLLCLGPLTLQSRRTTYCSLIRRLAVDDTNKDIVRFGLPLLTLRFPNLFAITVRYSGRPPFEFRYTLHHDEASL